MAANGCVTVPLLEQQESRMTSTASSLVDDDGAGSESNFSSRGGEDNPGSAQSLMESIVAIQNQTTYLSHQMSIILRKFNIVGCQCATCLKQSKSVMNNCMTKMNGYPVLTKENITTQENLLSEQAQNGSVKKEPLDLNLNDMPTDAMLELLSSSGSGGSISGPVEFGIREGECRRGRKSKYCSAETKMLVVDYAQRYGPSAAARKFNIPPAVASYYYRKFNNQKKRSDFATSPTDLESPLPRNGNDSVFDDSIGSQSAIPTAPHVSGSPGFLRGRGRGRPKLIGDELDANLVDYMVEIKRNDPRHHLTAAAALEYSREYIRKKAPGLLEEEGGPVNLKHTWAMKLLNRVTEREAELLLLNSNSHNFEAPTTTHTNELMTMVTNLVNQMSQNGADVASNDNTENEMTPPPPPPATDCNTSEEVNDMLKNFIASMMQST